MGLKAPKCAQPQSVHREGTKIFKLPFANDLPAPLRSIARRFAGPRLRHRLAADFQHLVHLQARSHPLFRRSRRTLSELAGRHDGEACVIVGNGPSIAGQDLRQLSCVPVFCLNRGYLLWNEQGLSPSYHVAFNDLVIEQFHDEIGRLRCPLFLPWQYHEFFADARHAVFVEPRWHPRFFRDVSNGLWVGATVTFATLQIAYHMGFRTVILIGVDHRFKDQGPAHLEVMQTSDDTNHFRPDYFGAGTRWNLPDLVQSEDNYRLAESVYRASGRRIIDSTVGGALEIFEKMPLAEALRLTSRSSA